MVMWFRTRINTYNCRSSKWVLPPPAAAPSQSVKFWSRYQRFLSRMCIWKYLFLQKYQNFCLSLNVLQIVKLVLVPMKKIWTDFHWYMQTILGAALGEHHCSLSDSYGMFTSTYLRIDAKTLLLKRNHWNYHQLELELSIYLGIEALHGLALTLD